VSGLKLEAVLFDMVGTLVDSEKVWDVGLHELAARYGGELSQAGRTAMLCTSSLRTAQILLAALGQPWRDPHSAAEWLTERMAELFAAGLDWLPGARELLDLVRADGLRTALVTNTGRALVDVALGSIGADYFDIVVCGDEVTFAKPHPEPYLTAATSLGVDPRRCVAIEDSVTGVASAQAAGCTVIAVPGRVSVPESDALVLNSLLMADLSLLRGLVSSRHVIHDTRHPQEAQRPHATSVPDGS
jgi:HAD superfamily hydrolase (TIGR01509 family)